MEARNEPILHIATEREWQAAQTDGAYRAASLESEGFIHCSTPGQLPGVLGRHFAGVASFVLLEIDSNLIDRPVIWGDTAGAGERHPSVNGAIPLDAVLRVSPIRGSEP